MLATEAILALRFYLPGGPLGGNFERKNCATQIIVIPAKTQPPTTDTISIIIRSPEKFIGTVQ